MEEDFFFDCFLDELVFGFETVFLGFDVVFLGFAGVFFFGFFVLVFASVFGRDEGFGLVLGFFGGFSSLSESLVPLCVSDGMRIDGTSFRSIGAIILAIVGDIFI